MPTGFYIRKVKSSGNNVKDATISFQKGANLVTGASDTGKSYIFSIINYVLGRSKEPKDIPESSGYINFLLEIGAHNDESVYTLSRTIGKDRIEVKKCESDYFLTSDDKIGIFRTSGGTEEEKNISEFLLTLCNLNSKKLLQSKAKGTTQNLSFKNINQLTSIAEDRIITEESPFYPSNQVISRTPEQALLKLILTGEDFSDVVEKEDKAKRETSLNGKIEYISSQLSSLVIRREELLSEMTTAESKSYDTESVLMLEKKLEENLSASRELIRRRNRLLTVKEKHAQKESYYSELGSRFSILKTQYISDKKRLEFILEAENLSEQLGDVVCPVCASPLDSNHINHIKEIDNFKLAATQEYVKISDKLADLEASIQNLNINIQRAKDNLVKTNLEIDKLEIQLKEKLNPEITYLKNSLSGYLQVENRKSEIQFIDNQMKTLYANKDRFEQLLSEKIKEEDITILEYSVLLELSQFIKERLNRWNYENMTTVLFDSSFKIFDIVISGKSRRSYGKGKRAISYSACLLGTLDYCMAKNTPFSNLVILDSPLTTFEEKKGQPANDEISMSVQGAFFKDLSETPNTCQIIVFDNKIPSPQTYPGLSIVVFTGSDDNGRKGFY